MSQQRTSQRRTARATISPTTADLHWAAGFLEGEGNFHVSNNRDQSWSAMVRAVQAQREPLEKLQRLFGGNVRLKSAQRPHRQAIWIWAVSGTRARGVMMTLYGLMSTRRREQIRSALSHFKPGPAISDEARHQRAELGRRRYLAGTWMPPVLQRAMDPQWRARIGAAQKKLYAQGKIPPSLLPEVQFKLSQSLRGHRVSEETKQKLRKHFTGRLVSAETRARMAEARKRWWERKHALAAY